MSREEKATTKGVVPSKDRDDGSNNTPTVFTTEQKINAIRSNWWHVPMQTLFPDKRFDGQLQNPKTQQVFDFDDVVMKKANSPFDFVQDNDNQVIYYPPQDTDKNLYTIFIPGLGQTEATSSQRSCRYGERLQTGIVNLNNGSFLKQNPLLTKINPLLDWLDATVHRIGLSGSLVIDNCAILILCAIDHQVKLNLSSDSHGTILLGRALWIAKEQYMKQESAGCAMLNREQYEKIEKQWEELSHKYVNIVAFGNGYMNWVKGPKYVMINLSTDPLTTKLGITPERAKDRPDIAPLIFESIFEEGNFEAHNMMYTIELLRQTFVKNGLIIGNFGALYHKLQDGALELVSAQEALSSEFPWPKDMKEYTWGDATPFEEKAKE